jgi:glycosyltransferase involved in cell wall biosynthesis
MDVSLGRKDGGAVVTYYQLLKMHELDPKHEFFVIPKAPEEADKRVLSFANFVIPKQMTYLYLIMQKLQIKTFWSFHIAQNLDPYVEGIHSVGGKIINWQTIHWVTDMIFTMDHIKDIDHWVAPTLFARSIMIQNGIEPDRITYIPHGVDITKFFKEPHKDNEWRKEIGIKPETKVILFSGRLDLWKGIHNLIPVVREFTEKYDVVFAIKGHPDMNNQTSKNLDFVMTTIHSRNPKFIYIPEWLSPDKMEILMRAADIVLSPSGHEGFNVPLAESMACARPVLTTALANHKEIVGKAGIFFKPTEQVGLCDNVQPIKVLSPEQIRDGLTYLLDNPNLCEELGTIGQERCKKLFNLETVSSNWLQLLERIDKS